MEIIVRAVILSLPQKLHSLIVGSFNFFFYYLLFSKHLCFLGFSFLGLKMKVAEEVVLLRSTNLQ